MMFLGLHSVARQLFCDEESLGYRKLRNGLATTTSTGKWCGKQGRTLTTWQSQLAGEIQEVKPIYSDQHSYLKQVLVNWDMQIYLFGENQISCYLLLLFQLGKLQLLSSVPGTHPAKLSNARVIHPSTSQQLSQFTWACGLIGQRVPSLPNCIRRTYPLTKSTASEPFRSTSVLGREKWKSCKQNVRICPRLSTGIENMKRLSKYIYIYIFNRK